MNSTCIYGVDLIPFTAELGKVSLWLEAMTPGRPLPFLDALGITALELDQLLWWPAR